MATPNGIGSTYGPAEQAGGLVLNALPQGYSLQEYALDGVLGCGGFGITYLATDRNLNCQVAVKEYLPADQAVRDNSQSVKPKSTDATAPFDWGLRRFLDEARALATFNHPNIVRVLRYFEANNTAYMVMELVTGQPLNEWAMQNQPMEEAKLLALIHPLLDGLQVVHAADFLHRDIKPSNIIVRPNMVPVLLDFGAARQLASRTGRELTAIVTPGYAALEQYHSLGNQGPWTDLYSLAAVMYTLVTGQRPIEAPGRTRNDPLPRATDAGNRAAFSDDLLRAIDWALSPDEEKRPSSVSAFARVLPNVGSSTSAPFSARQSQSNAPPRGAPEPIDQQAIAQLESALAAHLGPMAAVVVRRNATSHQNLDALRASLAQDIESESSRRLFLERTEALVRTEISRPQSQPLAPSRAEPSAPARAPAQSPGAQFDEVFLTAVEAELAHHLGPLARVLVKNSALKARDRAELFLLLSDHIADEHQRRAFIRKSVAAFRDQT